MAHLLTLNVMECEADGKNTVSTIHHIDIILLLSWQLDLIEGNVVM